MTPERTTPFLMANLGSELIRFFAFKEQHKMDLASASAQRALKMIAIITERDNRSAGQEALLLKQIIEDALSAAPTLSIGENDLNVYFAPFALRA